MKRLVFLSSVQREFAQEREAVRDFIRGNRLLGKHFDVFIFEDLPAKDRRPDELYLDQVDKCDVFVSLFGMEYGWEDPADGVSPTEREFDRATADGKTRLLFLKDLGRQKPHAKMAHLLSRAKSELVYKRFASEVNLTSGLYESLIEILEECGTIHTKPFDASPCAGASLRDIDDGNIKWFLPIARRERNLGLSPSADKKTTLTHLNLLEERELTNAAVLLFGKAPQRKHPSAVVKCADYHGTEVAKPIASHQVFQGTLFEQVNGAVDFAMSRLNRSVGTRAGAATAPVNYEIPQEAIAEIIVNAVAHRDYSANASVQVQIFVDRVEVSNPGRLPKGLRPDDLAMPHSSEPVNPLIARPLYLAHYIESLGTGTLDVIRTCREAELPLPEFEQRANQFVVTLWRDWLTADLIDTLDLNDRQSQAMEIIRRQRHIKTGEYSTAVETSRATAKRDLEDLVSKGLLMQVGAGRGAYYELPRKRLTIGSIGSSNPDAENGSEMAQTAQGRTPRAKSGRKAKVSKPRRKKK